MADGASIQINPDSKSDRSALAHAGPLPLGVSVRRPPPSRNTVTVPRSLAVHLVRAGAFLKRWPAAGQGMRAQPQQVLRSSASRRVLSLSPLCSAPHSCSECFRRLPRCVARAHVLSHHKRMSVPRRTGTPRTEWDMAELKALTATPQGSRRRCARQPSSSRRLFLMALRLRPTAATGGLGRTTHPARRLPM